MKPGQIRAISVCVVCKDDAIFVFEARDNLKSETFYRPLGGEVEFGERSSQTVIREFREEINSDITNLKYLGTLENIFTFEGEPGHEIVFVYQGDFVDPSIYEKATVIGNEDDGEQFKAMWKPLDDFRYGNAPLYPDGLLELLTDN
jgi:8-oxo-dGTP pyrophosphatase MutT (NUDIX family)